MNINEKRLTNTFLELVKLDSESLNEKAIHAVLVAKLKDLGCSVYVDKAGKTYGTNAPGNIIATLPGTLKSKPIILCSHMDTVPPGNGVKPILKKDRITSDGTTVLGADDKAGLSIILEVLATLKKQKLPHPPVEALFTLTEESGMLGAKALEYKKLKGSEGIILDNDDAAQLLVQGPAVNTIEVWIKGKSAHAGVCPERGISALELAAKALSVMQLGRIDAQTVANFAIISGGQATNIVTEDIYLKGEARSLNNAKLAKQTAHMKACFDKTAKLFTKKVDGKTLKPEIKFVSTLRYPALVVDKKAPIVKAIVAAGKAQGVDIKTMASGGGCDANILSGYGLTLPNLGLGMQECHTLNEYLDLKSFFLTASVVLGTVLNYKK